MPMIRSDNDEGLIVDAEVFQLLQRCFNRIVELEELAKSAVVVENVHLLVDAGCFAVIYRVSGQ